MHEFLTSAAALAGSTPLDEFVRSLSLRLPADLAFTGQLEDPSLAALVDQLFKANSYRAHSAALQKLSARENELETLEVLLVEYEVPLAQADRFLMSSVPLTDSFVRMCHRVVVQRALHVLATGDDATVPYALEVLGKYFKVNDPDNYETLVRLLRMKTNSQLLNIKSKVQVFKRWNFTESYTASNMIFHAIFIPSTNDAPTLAFVKGDFDAASALGAPDRARLATMGVALSYTLLSEFLRKHNDSPALVQPLVQNETASWLNAHVKALLVRQCHMFPQQISTWITMMRNIRNSIKPRLHATPRVPRVLNDAGYADVLNYIQGAADEAHIRGVFVHQTLSNVLNAKNTNALVTELAFVKVLLSKERSRIVHILNLNEVSMLERYIDKLLPLTADHQSRRRRESATAFLQVVVATLADRIFSLSERKKQDVLIVFEERFENPTFARLAGQILHQEVTRNKTEQLGSYSNVPPQVYVTRMIEFLTELNNRRPISHVFPVMLNAAEDGLSPEVSTAVNENVRDKIVLFLSDDRVGDARRMYTLFRNAELRDLVRAALRGRMLNQFRGILNQLKQERIDMCENETDVLLLEDTETIRDIVRIAWGGQRLPTCYSRRDIAKQIARGRTLSLGAKLSGNPEASVDRKSILIGSHHQVFFDPESDAFSRLANRNDLTPLYEATFMGNYLNEKDQLTDFFALHVAEEGQGHA